MMDKQTDYISEHEKLKAENAYLKKITEQNISKIMFLDAQAMAMRNELEQKRRGFSLMAGLAVTFSQDGIDYESMFASVSKRINAALNMQRTIVLVPGAEKNVFRVSIMQGYPAEEKIVLSRRVHIEPEMLDPANPVLVTGGDPVSRLAKFRETLSLPYFISSPVILYNDVIAILVTGRTQEQMHFAPRLGQSDMETVQTVSAYLAAMLTGRRLQEAENLANYDPLTQLPNLRRTKEELHQILALAKRGGFSVAVMFVDLDGFKGINDTYGHLAGDKVLKIVAERLIHSVRESDLVGRIGGDEFVVILSHIMKPEDAGVVAGKIIEKLQESIDIQGVICHISASIGIALAPAHGSDWTSLVNAADEAMYKIKSKGKNAFGFVQTSEQC